MENKKLEEVVAISVYDFEKFKANYEKEFYINVIRQLPNVTFTEYLRTLFNQTFIERTKLYEIRNNIIEKGERFSELYEDVSKTINEVGAIGMFLDERIKFEDGKKYEQEQHIKKITDVKEKNHRIDLSAPERLQLLWDLGFNDLPKVKELTEIQYKKLMVTILNFNARDIEGYINSQKENSEESKFIITNKHTQKVKKYLDNL